MIKVVGQLGAEAEQPNRLSVSVAVGEGESTVVEFGRVRDVLLKWHKSGRGVRGALEIEIQTEESRSSDTLHTFMNVVSEKDALLGKLCGSLSNARICTVTPAGKRIKTIGFDH